MFFVCRRKPGAVGLQVVRPSAMEDFDVLLYSSRVSPFCTIVATFLRFERSLRVAHVEVEPWRKAQLAALPLQGSATKHVLPTVVLQWRDGRPPEQVAKADEIVTRLQELLGKRAVLPPFTKRHKNQCMLMNAEVLPVVALNRHASIRASRAACAYMREHAAEWGHLQTTLSRTLVPLFYWRIWKRMAWAVLKDAGADTPEEALIKVLERWQEKRTQRFFGGATPDLCDVWMFGHLHVCEDEDVFSQVISKRCPTTAAWYADMRARVPGLSDKT